MQSSRSVPLTPFRSWLSVLACTLFACSPSDSGGESPSNANSEGRKQSTPPNVVVIYVDDMGWGDVGYHNPNIQTPNIDALAKQGLQLERFYASPMCTPSRAQLLTGFYAQRYGLEENLHPRKRHGLAGSATTLAERLKQAGFQTALVGKWHLGFHLPAFHPNAQGFDQFYGHLGGWIDYQTHERLGTPDWWRDEDPLQESGYATDLIAIEASQALRRRDPSKPIFLCVMFNAPHTPTHQAPGRTPHTKGSPRALYETMVASLDEGIGQVLETLDALAIQENTIVFFASDNGAHPKFGGSNGKLRGQKFGTFEGGIRTPAILRWPGHLKAGVSNQYMTNLDLVPTLCDWLDLPKPEVDGASMAQGLISGVAVPRNELLFYGKKAGTTFSALLTPPHKFVRRVDPSGDIQEWLFNVEFDEVEAQDLQAVEPKMYESMSNILSEKEEQFEAR